MSERTQVAIIGAGPAGSALSLLLQRHGVESAVLERQSRDYVLGRIRAGVLEWSSVGLLERIDVAARMHREGHVHDTIKLGWAGKNILEIDMRALTGTPMMAWGQTELQHDLYEACDARGIDLRFEAADVALHGLDTDRPWVTFVHGGAEERIDCDLVAGCDGFHGVSRTAIPGTAVTEYEKAYPFGWLGLLSETRPLPTLVYANHERGFALCSQRNPTLSRYYVQCPLEDSIDDWPDDRFWSELLARVPRVEAERIVTGPSIEKSIAPLRSIDTETRAEKRYALVIGNSAYSAIPDLPNARSDADVMAQFLRSQDYVVHHHDDITKRGFEDVLRRILFDVDKDTEVVVFFAGHGFQIGSENYLVPVDADSGLRDA